jgi:hypothetical protein
VSKSHSLLKKRIKIDIQKSPRRGRATRASLQREESKSKRAEARGGEGGGSGPGRIEQSAFCKTGEL